MKSKRDKKRKKAVERISTKLEKVIELRRQGISAQLCPQCAGKGRTGFITCDCPKCRGVGYLYDLPEEEF